MDERKDPVVEAYKEGFDQTLIEHSLTLTIDERLQRLVAMAEFRDEARKASAATQGR